MLKMILLVPLSFSLMFADGPVVKTGQTTVYKAGDDGTYQSGLARSYSRANGVVTDNATGLEWQDNVSSVSKQWLEDAKNVAPYDDTSGDTATTYCNELVLDGKSDWRLPTQKELRTLVDYSKTDPSIDSVFVNVTSLDYWSSTTYAGDTSDAWVVNFNDGNDDALIRAIVCTFGVYGADSNFGNLTDVL